MLVQTQSRLVLGLLAGFAALAWSPQPATSKPDNRARDAAEAAAREAMDSTAPAADAAATPADDQADPDCAQPDLEATADEHHAIDDPYGKAFTGAQSGRIKLVVFADYGCPACRQAQPVLDRLVAESPNLQVVYRIVNNEPDSTGVTGVSLQVARSNGDWQAFHHALDAGDSVSDDAIGKALDAAHLKKSCYLPSDAAGRDILVLHELERNNQFLYQRRLKSFPSWVIGQGPVREGIDYATLKAAVARAAAGAR